MEDQVQCIWRLPTVMARTGMCKSCIYQMAADGTFPRPVRLGRRSVGWHSKEVEGWIAERVTASPHSKTA
jgi:prophage regulatory protein